MPLLPIKINATLAVSKEQTIENIEKNLTNIPNWYDRLFYPNGYEAIIVSAGPSMEKYVEQLNIKERMSDPNRGFILFCVKHSLPRLLDMGIEPDFCVILDGRPLDDKSTHGKNRKDLFKTIPEKTIFMVASMASHEYGSYLLSRGARVLGWHTEVNGLEEFQGRINGPVLGGGTSSGARTISLANTLGMREITLVGFDSCVYTLTEEMTQEVDFKGRPKFMQVELQTNEVSDKLVGELGTAITGVMEKHDNDSLVIKTQAFKRFWTTGELAAQAQDFEHLFTERTFDMQFHVYDDGMVSHIFKNCGAALRDYSFIQYFQSVVPRKVSTEGLEKRNVNFVKSKGDPVE